MHVISSSDLPNEFTLYADKIVDENETMIVQRASGKNLVVMSMDEYNKIQRRIYQARQSAGSCELRRDD